MVMCHWSEGREDWEVKLGSANRQHFGGIDNQGNIILLGTVKTAHYRRRQGGFTQLIQDRIGRADRKCFCAMIAMIPPKRCSLQKKEAGGFTQLV